MAKKEIKSKEINRLDLEVGDTVSIHQKGHAVFTGVIIKKHKKSDPSASFTIRTILSGVGVEKIYPLHLPTITKIERIKRAKVRRAKLYYLRDKIGKKTQLKEIKTEPKRRKKPSK